MKLINIFLGAFAILLFVGCGSASLGTSAGLGGLAVNDGNGSSGASAIATCSGTVDVNTFLYIRSAPEIGDNVCGTLTDGAEVRIRLQNPESGYYVLYSELCGDSEMLAYASTSFVELGDDCPVAE